MSNRTNQGTTIDNLTDAQIDALSTEAAQAGDDAMVRLCRLARLDVTAARKGVVAAIRENEAQS